MKCDEVAAWRPFKPLSGEAIDLSFLDAHEVTYTHQMEGKADVTYKFLVTYSFHCFAKDYPHLTDDLRAALMYRSGREDRPFCRRRYHLARTYLREMIDNLPHVEKVTIQHGGYGGYLATEKVDENGGMIWYLVSFKAYTWQKKYRLHITSAYPVDEKPGGGKVKFFTIAHNLAPGKPLPKPHQ